MLGDEQGSTSVMMPVTIQPGGQLQGATLADAAASTRTSYTPYGQLRGADNEDLNRGWLGQVEDTGTGLTYLNARYYDPVLSRFLSPDPLMDPGDPRTLDPYLYSSNNPVVFTDASGLRQDVGGAVLNDQFYSNPVNKNVSTFTGVARKGSAGGGLTGGTRGSTAGSSGGSGYSTVMAVVELEALRSASIKETSPATARLEESWLTWGLANGGRKFNGGPMCGRYMVCIVGHLPTGSRGNAITIGRVVLFDDPTPNAWWQFHEYGHVVDQLDVGVDVFLRDYAREAAFAKITGLDEHDENVLEMLPNARAGIALKEYEASGTVPMKIFETSAYEAGYEPIYGVPSQWLVWWVQIGSAQSHNTYRTRAMIAQMD